ncbi:MAG: hypothetical protein HY926_16185, partial [Elusimicrobia bacterium]|nr:hypothetical protein [Elusimicrobiota bacterium]
MKQTLMKKAAAAALSLAVAGLAPGNQAWAAAVRTYRTGTALPVTGRLPITGLQLAQPGPALSLLATPGASLPSSIAAAPSV